MGVAAEQEKAVERLSHGTFVRGTWQGVVKSGAEGQYEHIVVRCYPDGEGKPFDRRMDFRRFDEKSGELTAVGKAMDELTIGQLCEVKVFGSVRSPKGIDPFTVYAALAIRPL
jgi:hypothetical protein